MANYSVFIGLKDASGSFVPNADAIALFYVLDMMHLVLKIQLLFLMYLSLIHLQKILLI